MKHKKRILTLLLAFMMLGTILVGCANGTPAATTTPAPGAQSTPAPATGQPPAAPEELEHLNIEWLIWADAVRPDINECEFMILWQDMFNIHIEVIGIPYDQWTSSLRIWANAGDLPDVAQFEYNHVDGAMWAEQELVKKLPDDWKVRWPNLSAANDRTVVGDVLEKSFGGTYFLPRPIFNDNQPVDPLVSHQGIYFRKDRLQEVGAPIQTSYTPAEFLDVARTLQQNDLTGLPYVISNSGGELGWMFVYPVSTFSMNASEYFQDSNGQFQWGPAQPETLEGLKYYQQAWDEGLIHPEFFAASGHQDMFIVAGEISIIQAPGMAVVANRFGNNFREHQGLEPEEWLHFAFVTRPDGVFTGPEAPNYWGSLIMNPSIPEVKFTRLMDLLDYSSTVEGQNAIRMGIPEVDWTYEDGQLKSLLAAGENILDLHISSRPFWANLYIVSDDFGLINPAFPQIFRDMARNAYLARQDLSTPDSIGRINWDLQFFDSDARRRAQVNLGDEYAELIITPGNIEDKWNAWVAERMIVVQPVLDEMNAAFN